MKRLIHYLKFTGCILLLTLFAGHGSVFAQTTIGASAEDSLQEVEILSATKRLTFKTVDDTTKLTIISGDVKLKQGNTLFYCDSCVINNNTNVFEAWGRNGKVHINDYDTTHIYSSHLRYLIKTKQAYLDGGVRMTDGKATLTTPDLEYDMETNIGIYKNGGKVINKKTVLTSQEGWYYADMKDVYFKRNVILNDPAYKIVTDSLLYNSESQTTRFISETIITDSNGRIIKTKEGYYNQQTGKAEFGQRPTIIDGNTEIKANRVAVDDSSGISVAEGNAIIVDKKNQTTIIAGIIYRNKNTDAILATRKPLMIIKQDNDSIYITADTLFSARLTDLYRSRQYVVTDSIANDTVAVSVDNAPEKGADSIAINNMGNDSITLPLQKETGNVEDSSGRDLSSKAARFLSNRPSGPVASPDSAVVHTKKGVKTIAINEKDSTNRYFEAYRHVRIFNDSLQAVCDSMFYSFQDSVFRLYDDPVVWAKESQITGDTIHLFTKNKKADKVEAYDNSFLVNRMDDQAFNQIKATRMDGYFVNGDIDSVRAKGFAECIYYIQDEDSAYTGVNQSKSDIMDIYFRNKELYKVVFRSSVTGTLWPIRQKSPSEMQLPNFRWLEERRPKTRLEMYE
ncbi:MAG: OstA family protein [Chitinophagaceae bacterium]|nr:OstA family protein [Chitinophagaceae bacterium]